MVKNSVDLLGDDFVSRLRLKGVKKPPSTVYHYTTAEGLFGMLKSKEIWATHYKFLNDKKESCLGQDLAVGVAREKLRKGVPDRQAQFLDLLQEFIRNEDDEEPFVFSLSEEEDDLSQWRSYAAEGKGFTIGFDAQMLSGGESSGLEFAFRNVTYSTYEHEKWVEQIIQEFLNLVDSDDPNIAYADMPAEAASGAELAISNYSIFCKHRSFASEKEWRINSWVDPQDVLVRVSDGNLTPFTTFPIPGEGVSAIKRIGIGPGFEDPAVRYAVERLCHQHGFSAVEIYNADTPFRRSA